jgi:hypothetical protein
LARGLKGTADAGRHQSGYTDKGGYTRRPRLSHFYAHAKGIYLTLFQSFFFTRQKQSHLLGVAMWLLLLSVLPLAFTAALPLAASCNFNSTPLVVYALHDVTTQSTSGATTWKLRARLGAGVDKSCVPAPVAYNIQWLDFRGHILLDSGELDGVLPPSEHISGPDSAAVANYRVRVRYVLPVDSRQTSPARWTSWALGRWRRAPGPSISAWGDARWICTGPTSTDVRSSMLRTEFVLPSGRVPVSATVSVVGLGQFQLRVNGADVGGDANVPGWTTWSKRVLFSTYDVDGLVPAPASNALGVLLGNGMYNVPDPAPRYTKWVGSSGPRMLLLQLVVVLDDGSMFNVSSQSGAAGGWAATDGGPIVFTHQYAGEDFNASLAVPGWDAPGFVTNPLVAWSPAQNCMSAAPAGLLLPSEFDPVRVMEALPALNVTPSQPPGTVLVDVGRNFAGFAEVQLEGVPPGSTVRVWPSETAVGGVIQQASGGTPMYWQTFVSNSSAVTVRPSFSTYGWRWLAVQVLPQAVDGVPSNGTSNGTITILSASYGYNCDASLIGDVTAAVASWCGSNASSCTYEVCVCGDNTCGAGAPPCITDPASGCPKAFSVSWRCSLDPPGTNRTAVLPAEADNNAVTLNCLPPPPVPFVPVVTSATGFFTRSSVPRVGNWTSSNAWVNRIHNITVEVCVSVLFSSRG